VRHLAPVDLKERGGKTGPDVHKAGARCSNKGFLPMSPADYLQLLDWPARQQHSGKRGSPPQHLVPLFERLGISVDVWCQMVKDFGRLFSVVAGQPHRIDEHRCRSKENPDRFRARQATRELMSPASRLRRSRDSLLLRVLGALRVRSCACFRFLRLLNPDGQ